MKPGAPGSALPMAARRAVTLASGRGRWGIRWRRQAADVFPMRINGYLIALGAPRFPWGRSLHTSGYLTHAVDELYLIWQHGTVLGACARWRCNAQTYRFRLLDEPDSPICPLCTIERVPRERKS